jgi:hypothetical protein
VEERGREREGRARTNPNESEDISDRKSEGMERCRVREGWDGGEERLLPAKAKSIVSSECSQS